jgi:UDP-N-acetylmuramate--alanine ligase
VTQQGSLHFVGIGGIGMSAIARVLLARGETVTGSDISESPLLDELRRQGATIAVGHDAKNVNGARTVIVSSAIDSGNPEYVHANARQNHDNCNDVRRLACRRNRCEPRAGRC